MCILCITVTFCLRDLSIWEFGIHGGRGTNTHRHRGVTVYRARDLSSTDHSVKGEGALGHWEHWEEGKTTFPLQQVRTSEPSVMFTWSLSLIFLMVMAAQADSETPPSFPTVSLSDQSGLW